MSVSSMLDVDRLAEEALSRLGVLLELKASFLFLKDTESDIYCVTACVGMEEDAGMTFCPGEPLIDRVMKSGQGTIQNYIDRQIGACLCRHLMAIPLKAGGEILGVLGVIDKESSDTSAAPFNQEDERVAVAFSGQTAIAISNALLYTHLQSSHRQLEAALEELQTTQKQMIQQERLRALGQMASGVVHDVNNAISAILGYTELWIMFPKMLDNRSKVLHDLQTINTAAKDATHIIRRLRGFYRPREEGNTMLPVSLNEVIEQAVDISEPGAVITVVRDLQDIAPIEGDDADLREMFINLIFNATDAMPTGGTLTFHTRVDENRAVLEVSDTGIGMSDEIREKCLEPFFSTKGERGTGMGLAMVFGIIQRHRGTLEIDSSVGKGTTFRIRFLLAASSLMQEAKGQGAGALPPLSVLVVEDDPVHLAQIVRYLEEDNHKTVTATSGVEGLEKFHKGQFDVVITDAVMREMDGFLLARAIKNIAPRKPILMITGHTVDFDEEEEQTEQVITVLLQKPVILQLFRRALPKAVEVGRGM